MIVTTEERRRAGGSTKRTGGATIAVAMFAGALPIRGTVAASTAVAALWAGMPVSGPAAANFGATAGAKAAQQPLFRPRVDLVAVDAAVQDAAGGPSVDL